MSLRRRPAAIAAALALMAGCTPAAVPPNGNLAPGVTMPGQTAAVSPTGLPTDIVSACRSYAGALQLATPYARNGLLSARQDGAVTMAIEHAGPVCRMPAPDPSMLPVVRQSLAVLAGAGIPIY